MDDPLPVKDQDFFEVDPVRYADALGEHGLRAYRQAVAELAIPRSFAARYAHERLAILDGDIDELVQLLGGDLSGAHQFQRVAEAMVELDRPDLALDWATRGIDKTSGWQIANLYDLACKLHVRADTPSEALRLRRAHHERSPSGSTYGALRSAAGACDAWHLATRSRGFASPRLSAGSPIGRTARSPVSMHRARGSRARRWRA